MDSADVWGIFRFVLCSDDFRCFYVISAVFLLIFVELFVDVADFFRILLVFCGFC